MEAFYVSIIFLGVLLIIGSLFFIAMDKVNGKDFFKEFDRKKEEMFNLIQDSEEMVQELNKISDYVVNVISEKNQEFFNKMGSNEPDKSVGGDAGILKEETGISSYEALSAAEVKPSIPVIDIPDAGIPDVEVPVAVPPVSEDPSDSSGSLDLPVSDISGLIKEEPSEAEAPVPVLFDRNNYNDADGGKSRLVYNNRKKEVLQMIEQGMSNDEIADKLKIGKGEIGLIRVLNR